MIQNHQEFTIAQERIAYFLDLLMQLCTSSRPEELALVTSGYRAEVERMQREVLDYLTQPATQADIAANRLREAVASNPVAAEAVEAGAMEKKENQTSCAPKYPGF
jgi:hypothetical protein